MCVLISIANRFLPWLKEVESPASMGTLKNDASIQTRCGVEGSDPINSLKIWKFEVIQFFLETRRFKFKSILNLNLF